MRNKRLTLYALCVIIFIALTVPINRSINSSVGTQLSLNKKRGNRDSNSTPLEKTFPKMPPKQHSLAAEDPARYGILVKSDDRLPHNQAQWDLNMRKALAEPKGFGGKNMKLPFEKIEKAPKEFQKQLQRIEERIKAFEKLKRNNPDDQDVEKKLQTLYMLKATLTALEGDMTSKFLKD